MKNCTKLSLFGLLSLVFGLMPTDVLALTLDVVRNDNSTILNTNYHATLEDGTILGFTFGTTYKTDENDNYVYDENGGYVYEYWGLFTGAITEASSVVVPDSVRFNNVSYKVVYCGYRINDYSTAVIDFEEAPNVTTLTLPGSLWWINCIPSTIDELHILSGGIPSVFKYGVLDAVKIYVPTDFYESYMKLCQNGEYGWSDSYILIPDNGDPSWGKYNIHVSSAGQFAHSILNEIENFRDVRELTVSGSLNAEDLSLLSRMTEMYYLDLSQTDITSMAGCKELKLMTVLLPSTVTKIDEEAFYQCTSLSSISLPNVEEVGDYAFFGTALTSVELPQARFIGDCAFAGDDYYYSSSSSKLSEVQIPLVTTIGNRAFCGCNLLKDISMHNVKSIGYEAFANCYSLTEMDLSNVESIGQGAFYMNVYYGSSTLTSVKLPDNLTAIPEECFAGCPLENIDFPSALESIGERAFQSCNLTSITLPEGLQRIESGAFNGCPLKSISIPSTIEYMSSDAFSVKNVASIYSYAVVPFATSAFSNLTSATLHVPAFSLNAYRLHDDWYHFASIVPIEGDLEKLHINSDFAIYDYKGLTEKVDMTLSYGREYMNDWSSSSTSAHVTVNADSTFTLGEYIQYQDLYSYDFTTLITQNEITADKMCTNVYMRDGSWNFISFPYDVNVSDIVVPEGVLWVIRKYSGSDRAAMTGNTWQNMTDGMVLKAGEGYIFHCYDEEDNEVCVSFPSASNDEGTLFAYDDVVKTLAEYPSEFAHNRSWNLVGNPYPSYFNTQEIEFDAPITVWNGSGYTAYSLLDDNYVLTPNEAFFVQRPINAATMTFHKEGRMHDELESADEDYAPSFTRTRSTSATRFVYNFLLADGSYTDRARLVVNEEAKAEYEVNCDASKFMSSNAAVPQLYIHDGGVKYAIDERPLGNGVITLGAYFGKAGEHTISLASNPNEELAVMLTDHLTGTVTNLVTDSYTFTAEAGTSDDRFAIALAPTTDIENSVADKAPITEVYTLDGKLVTDIDNLPAGVYLVKKGGEYVKHVITE